MYSAALLLLSVVIVGCGKRGPPLPPLNLLPDAPVAGEARVLGDTVYIPLTIPIKNINGPGVPILDRLEIYAVTVAPGAPPPPNRDLLTSARLLTQIALRPPVDPDAETDETTEPDPRPGPGDQIVFADKLTEAEVAPQIFAPTKRETDAGAGKDAPPPASAAGMTAPIPPIPPVDTGAATGGTPAVPEAPPTPPNAFGEPPPTTVIGGVANSVPPPVPAVPAADTGAATGTTPPAAAAPPLPTTVTRLYIVRAFSKKGHPGNPSRRVVIPIVPAPPAPASPAAAYTESAVQVSWTPIVPTKEQPGPFAYFVYPSTTSVATATGVTAAVDPLNAAPLVAPPFEQKGAEPGREQCFVVRAFTLISATQIQSEPTPPVCVTPVDRFPPSAPKGLAVVATAGAVNLIWDANAEADVSGYIVLRGETSADTLQPLTPEPIRETRFRDTTARPGIRYAYAIVAIDRAGNRSTPSARVEETGR